MSKDPAVLFYTKDWLEGTVDMFPEEKGVYIDLLSYQHQKGFLPQNTRRLAKITGISEEQFVKIWSEIKHKFVTIDSLDTSLSEVLTDWKNKTCSKGNSEELVNLRMLKETVSRKKISSKKSIQAYVTNWFRYDATGKTIAKSQKQKILKAVDYTELLFIQAGKKEVYAHLHTLTQRTAKRSQKANGDVNANASINVNKNEDEDAKKNPVTFAFDDLTMPNFKKRVCTYFSQNGKLREKKVDDFFEELEYADKLREFWLQTEAYMHFKNNSGEKIHSWKGYCKDWETSDWINKNKQLNAQTVSKRTFSINR
ncbi:DUF1376 domain-containing protein [Aquimarina sediminis]|uniref:DUF1376 domain-containing protein n=1 Tax=Aquimarina sediminis TaxID=2070536 RepID=UPI000CA031C9|nr:DUF1376 domain-containing protein [Aquimarina sediminis]